MPKNNNAKYPDQKEENKKKRVYGLKRKAIRKITEVMNQSGGGGGSERFRRPGGGFQRKG